MFSFLKHKNVRVNNWRKRTMQDSKSINNFIKYIKNSEEIEFKLNFFNVYEANFHAKNVGDIIIELDKEKKLKNLYINLNLMSDLMVEEELEIINEKIKSIMSSSKMRLKYLLNQEAY